MLPGRGVSIGGAGAIGSLGLPSIQPMSDLASYFAVAALALPLSCAQDGPVMTSTPNSTSVAGSAEELARSHARAADLACDLHRALVEGSEGANVFFSPKSITAALAMLAEGARGETEVEFARALQGTAELDWPSLCAQRVDLAERLDAPGEGNSWSEANGIWADEAGELVEATRMRLELQHGASVQPADFRSAHEAVRSEVNRWVEERTNERIRDLLPPGSLTVLTRLVLVNAVHFLGKWEHEFPANKTSDGTFRCADGTDVTVPFVRDTRGVLTAFMDAEGTALDSVLHAVQDAAEGAALSVFELPYKGGQLSFMGVMPTDPNRLGALEARVDTELLGAWVEALSVRRVSFAMPKLNLEPSYDLKPTLRSLGFDKVMDPHEANLSGFFGGGATGIHLTDAFHKAFLCVDEAGTEAAAATGLVVGTRMAQAKPLQLTIDRPYLIFIRERTSGAILFMGRIHDPE